MNPILTTKVSDGFKSEVVVVFYLITFLAGGFFLLFGRRLGFVIEVIAAMLYISVTVLFYSLSKRG